MGRDRKGLTPLLPTVDAALFTLVNDLAARGLLDSTLVLMMGEFGRTPVMTPTAGRGHWTNCMSMVVAGGGLPHGRVIGSTDRRGYDIAEGAGPARRPGSDRVRPSGYRPERSVG